MPTVFRPGSGIAIWGVSVFSGVSFCSDIVSFSQKNGDFSIFYNLIIITEKGSFYKKSYLRQKKRGKLRFIVNNSFWLQKEQFPTQTNFVANLNEKNARL